MLNENETNKSFEKDEVLTNEDLNNIFTTEGQQKTRTTREEKNKNITIIISSIIILALIATLAFIFMPKFLPNNESKEQQKNETTSTIQETQNPTTQNNNTTNKPVEDKNPLLESIVTPNEVQTSEIASYVEDNSFTTTNNKTIFINNGLNVSGTKDNCIVSKKEDFCYSGMISTANGDKSEVYFLKDAAHSRLFENPTSFEKIEIPGTATSAKIETNISGQDSSVMVIVFDDMSGYMIVLNNVSDPLNITQSISVE